MTQSEIDFIGVSDTSASLFDCLPKYLYFLKEAENLTYINANRRFLEMLSLELSDIVGKQDHELFPHFIAETCVGDDRKVISGGIAVTNKIEFIPNRHGLVDWCLTNKVPMLDEDGRVIAVAGVSLPFSPSDKGMNPNSEIEPTVQFVRENFTQKISIPHLAQQAELSISSFERHFKKSYHMTVTEYVRHLRVQKGCDQLANSKDRIAEIALDCGYCDQSHFHRDFKRIMNTSPSKYRALYCSQ